MMQGDLERAEASLKQAIAAAPDRAVSYANLANVFAVSERDGHPNSLAHSIDAQAIFDYLVARQLLALDKPANNDH